MTSILTKLAGGDLIWACINPSWDETRHRLFFKYLGRQIKQSVEVMVMVVYISWQAADGEPQFLEVINIEN